MGIILKMAAAHDDPNPDLAPITFEDFWRLYPRKIARKPAFKVWAKIKPECYPLIIKNIKERSWPERQFIPYPATYLYQERWTDEEEPTMGVCKWNCNGNREPGRPQCDQPATREKNGVVYCKTHIGMVN